MGGISSSRSTTPFSPLTAGSISPKRGGGWGVVSILPFPDGAGSTTNVLYELSYDQVQVAEQGGTQVLTLTKGSTVTKIPVYDLPGILAAKGVPSAQFPLTRGKLPSFSDVSPGTGSPSGWTSPTMWGSPPAWGRTVMRPIRP